MSPDEYIKSQITSPLSEATYRSRTNLLLAASTAIVIYHTGLIPHQIDGLGITFSSTQQQAFISCLLILIAYQLISFSLSAIPDYYIAGLRRKAYTESCLSKEDFHKPGQTFEELKSNFNEIFNPLETDSFIVNKLTIYRVLFDIAMPLIIALYSIFLLIQFLYK
jgi:hypothetical protein